MRNFKLKKYLGMTLTERAVNCLHNAGIGDIETLLKFDRRSLLRAKNMGVKSVDLIEFELSNLGLRLKPGSEPPPKGFFCPHCGEKISYDEMINARRII